jgi:hypothetical protein
MYLLQVYGHVAWQGVVIFQLCWSFGHLVIARSLSTRFDNVVGQLIRLPRASERSYHAGIEGPTATKGLFEWVRPRKLRTIEVPAHSVS